MDKHGDQGWELRRKKRLISQVLTGLQTRLYRLEYLLSACEQDNEDIVMSTYDEVEGPKLTGDVKKRLGELEGRFGEFLGESNAASRLVKVNTIHGSWLFTTLGKDSVYPRVTEKLATVLSSSHEIQGVGTHETMIMDLCPVESSSYTYSAPKAHDNAQQHEQGLINCTRTESDKSTATSPDILERTTPVLLKFLSLPFNVSFAKSPSHLRLAFTLLHTLIGTLRVKSCALVLHWHQLAVLAAGQCYVEWRQRLLDLERRVHRVKAKTKSTLFND